MSSRLISDLKTICAVPCANFMDYCHKEKIFPLITCTLRSNEEQDRLYTIGRLLTPKGFGKIVTNAKGGESAHNYGLAFDFTLIIDGKINWNIEHIMWKRAVEIGKECGLESLYPMESAHLQVPNWKKYIELKK